MSNGSVHFDPAVGCDQGAEGLVNGKAWDWYIENVKEECDSPGEYFFDAEEEALFFTFNGTDAPSGDEDLSFTQTKVLFNISGTMAKPVQHIAIRGLTIRDAAYTYVMNHADLLLELVMRWCWFLFCFLSPRPPTDGWTHLFDAATLHGSI